MPVGKFRKRPVVIEACQWTGGNWVEIRDFCTREDGFSAAIYHESNAIVIDTAEGPMRGDLFDWVIRGTVGEFYPCKPEVFELVYERVG